MAIKLSPLNLVKPCPQTANGPKYKNIARGTTGPEIDSMAWSYPTNCKVDHYIVGVMQVALSFGKICTVSCALCSGVCSVHVHCVQWSGGRVQCGFHTLWTVHRCMHTVEEKVHR